MLPFLMGRIVTITTTLSVMLLNILLSEPNTYGFISINDPITLSYQ